MATHYSANQYQSAFTPKQLHCWSIPKDFKQHPSTHDDYTQFIANERGHLLAGVPRSQKNPWGTFLGTWDLPTKIPPSKLSLTSRSAEASKRLTNWIQNSEELLHACNGLQPQISGKASGKTDPPRDSSQGQQDPPVEESNKQTPLYRGRSKAESNRSSHRSVSSEKGGITAGDKVLQAQS
ncbi:protein Flattop [Xenopus laevis]|uniref:Protein Flattop n=1 Tax=Xenopus laevis TaxID=8355 RepID=FLTOP_XENLA|nr:protein Flattop [Xenopus laevis]Q3KPS4.1 RecName: Full=Protein Flattop; AltName: Full=Cilia- and flagella-associated protein 126 [Xenopus laevis]AAI06585.1 MGC131354 protein [Xenopus laevis]